MRKILVVRYGGRPRHKTGKKIRKGAHRAWNNQKSKKGVAS